MRKIILIVIGIAALTLSMTNIQAQTLKNPRPITYMMQTDTGKGKDSLVATSKVYIYPCGIGKYVKATITAIDTLQAASLPDSLVFFSKNAQGKTDTLSFKIWRVGGDTLKTVFVMPKTGSTDIIFWKAYPDYEIVGQTANKIYNALRKYLVNWIVQDGY